MIDSECSFWSWISISFSTFATTLYKQAKGTWQLFVYLFWKSFWVQWWFLFRIPFVFVSKQGKKTPKWWKSKISLRITKSKLKFNACLFLLFCAVAITSAPSLVYFNFVCGNSTLKTYAWKINVNNFRFSLFHAMENETIIKYTLFSVHQMDRLSYKV